MDKRIFITLSLIVFVSGLVKGDDPIDIDALKNQLPEGLIPSEYSNMTLPSVEDGKKLIREKCMKVSGSDAAYEEAEQASARLLECVTSFVNVTALQEEIKQAQPTGDLDTVFNKYCRKRNTTVECMKNFTNSIEPCLDDQERDNKDIFVRIFTNLLEFVCHKDGDQIALFIAEKGPQCFEEKKDNLIACMNSTFFRYLPSEIPSVDNLPKLVFGQEECDDMQRLQECAIKELETCEESTPANLVESMFKYVRKETPCNKFTVTPDTRANKANNFNAGFTFDSSVHTIVSLWIMTVFAKMAITA